ncbi:MAG: capsule biosynthesis protein, partial [Bacteroidetes bacterium]|nr:capsule biosynthesis protein [Bacteroidota bacterium]
MSLKSIREALKQGNLLFQKLSVVSANAQSNVNQYSLPDWQYFIATSLLWRQALNGNITGKRVLIPTSVGGLSAATILEGMLGVALTLRGAQVRFLLCDGVLPACLQVHAGKVKQTNVITDYKLKSQICPGCIARGDAAYKPTGLPISYYSDFINETEREGLRDLASGIPLTEIRAYQQDGVALGEHAFAGTLRFFACGHLPETGEAENVLRRYFEAALITNLVMGMVLAEHAPEVALFHHGIYVPQGIIGEVCRKRGVRVVNWQVGYRKKCFIFSHRETYHHTLISEPTSNWEDISWNEHLDAETTSYLKSRWHGSNDWIWFHEQPKHEAEAITKETGIDFSKPTITLLTNVFWDAQLHFKANAFGDMLDWLLKTIEYFKHRPDLQLAIRIHPAEVRGAIPSRQPLVAEVERVFPELPPNVYLIPPESQVSTYVLCENSDSVIIFGTKTGV